MDANTKANSNKAGMEKLDAAHKALHAHAKKVLQLFSQEKILEAEAEFTQLSEVSDTVRTLLSQPGLLPTNSAYHSFFEWSKDLEVGDARIDAQHQKLVLLVNELNRSLVQGQAQEQLQETLAALVDYTQTHFRDEEKLYLATAYPLKQEHLAQHHALEATVTKLQAEVTAGKTLLGADAMAFLKNWLVDHIKGTDQKLKEYLCSA